MAVTAPPKRALVAIPAQYAKFITALAGNAIAYLTAYGATWHLQPALIGIAAALAVFGIPNTPRPAAPSPAVLADRPTGGITP